MKFEDTSHRSPDKNAAPNRTVPRGATDWSGPAGDLGEFIRAKSEKTLRTYANDWDRVVEDANLEQDTARGGYAHRQLFELVQNGADALNGALAGGRIEVRLVGDHLYCADDGEPIGEPGVRALLYSRMSPKRGTSDIGRFGLGFKSVLRVTDSPAFFSRTGSFVFDRQHTRERIRAATGTDGPCPVLRIAYPEDPAPARDADPLLREYMTWASNIVRLPLHPGAADDLRWQIHDFPAEFLLFVEHVSRLTLRDGSAGERVLDLERHDGDLRLSDGESTTNWRVFSTEHQLSEDALADRWSPEGSEQVRLWWAAPLNRLRDPGHFWAFFPTETASLVAGNLNAPWKTNEDRQNLLPGPYNDELIGVAAKLIARSLPGLATDSDPVRHLDAMPRRHALGDSPHSDRLRQVLLEHLCRRPVVPDQDGRLRALSRSTFLPSS